MIYTIDYFIKRRKAKWEEDHNIERDKKFREVIADEVITNKEYINQIKEKPERMIELFFVVVDKEQNTVPFFLNSVQKDFINKLNKAISDYEDGIIVDISLLILKGRQQGFTTLITAYQLASTIINKNFQGFTVADEGTNTETIFQNKAKFPYEHLPSSLKPTEKFNNKRQFLFEKLNSSWEVNTATDNMGRSRTINFLHGSECAFWKHGIASTQAGIGEALTKNCIKIYESTANGFNDFEKMWSSGRHINCFYEWWRTPEYRYKFKDEKQKEKFLKVLATDNWINNRCNWLIEEKHLELEQVYWYYNKYLNYIDKELIKQEYPCTPQEAFLSTGLCYFDKEKIIKRLSEISKPIKRGYFDYKTKVIRNSNGEEYITIDKYNWIDDENGCIEIYEDVQKRNPYVLGGDTAGEGSDFFTAHIINNMTGKQVAKLKQKFNEIEYTMQVFCLGMYYNEALAGLETNFSTYPTTKLDEMRYPKLYIRDKEDTYENKKEKKLGFKTTTITRPLILAELQTIVLNEIEEITDKETLEEMLKFIKNMEKKGRPEAEIGYHDDLVMGLAITYYIRTQQTFKLLPIEVPEEQIVDYSEFGIKYDQRMSDDDFGSKIEII